MPIQLLEGSMRALFRMHIRNKRRDYRTTPICDEFLKTRDNNRLHLKAKMMAKGQDCIPQNNAIRVLSSTNASLRNAENIGNPRIALFYQNYNQNSVSILDKEFRLFLVYIFRL